MSVKDMTLLHQQIAASDFEQAETTAKRLAADTSFSFDGFICETHHAVNARQSNLALILLEGAERYFTTAVDAKQLESRVEPLTLLIASCRREKMDEPARRLSGLVLELLDKPDFSSSREALAGIAKFAGIAGRYALRRKDLDWFSAISRQTVAWAVRCESGAAGQVFLPVLDSWMHRITRQELFDGVPVLFESVFLLLAAEPNRGEFLNSFLQEWRTVAATACLNPENPLASEWVEQLLLLTIRAEETAFWRPVTQKIAEVASLAVAKHGVSASFAVFRPLLDVGRVNLGDELKFGTGPDETSLRQLIIRLVCTEAIRVADMAAHKDFSAITGDKIEEMYHSWLRDPSYESQTKSIERFCQLLLIFWSLNRKRAARRWTPREEKLAAPLLSEEERSKLSFLL